MSDLKPRKIIRNLVNFIEDKEILVLHGSRQVGKTSVLFYLMENFLKKEAGNYVFYFDLEDFTLLELCHQGPDRVIDYFKAKGTDFSRKIYLLIDEIQYLNNPSSFLKLFHDRYARMVKLIVSGSSSFLIKKRFKDSLVGRVIDFELFPLDFEEFLEFKDKGFELRVRMPSGLEDEIRELYKEFVIYGGYPAIVLEDDVQKKEIKLKQIIATYIKRDIRDMAEIREMDKFNTLIKVLACQSGSLLNISELSNTLRLSKKTIEDYIFLLENTYIIRRIQPFYKNIRSELSKMPKVYFEDTGLMNLLVNKTFSINISGNLLENSIYSRLRKNLDVENLYFWRTNKKQEVDFVIELIDEKKQIKIVPVEVKSIFLNKLTTHLRYFKAIYGVERAYLCCLSKAEECKDNELDVIYPWQINIESMKVT